MSVRVYAHGHKAAHVSQFFVKRHEDVRVLVFFVWQRREAPKRVTMADEKPKVSASIVLGCFTGSVTEELPEETLSFACCILAVFKVA